jgi:tetratricopeptide (TPR) repeat protein
MSNSQSPQEKAVVFKYLGFSYYRSGNLQDAIRCYEKSLKADGDDYDTLYNLGVAHLDNGAYDDAAEKFREAFAKNPNDSNAALGQAQAIDAAINAHMEKGSNLMVNSEYSQAIDEWQKVLQYQPGHPEAQSFIADAKKKLAQEVGKLYEAGKTAAKSGQTLEAMRQWNAALAMDTENAKVKDAIKQLNLQTSMKVSSYAAQGDEALATGDYAKAIQCYKLAQTASPSSAPIKQKLQKALTDQKTEFGKSFDAGTKAETAGRLREAIQDFTKAMAVDPSSAEAKQRLDTARVKRSMRIEELLKEGQELFDSGNHKSAQEKFNAVLALEPTQEKANDFIKKITGQQSKAKVDAEAVKKIYYEGVNLYINGNIQEAIAKWQECLKMDPGNVNAQGNINKATAKRQSIQKLRQG